MEYLMGIDIGTTNLKAIVYNEKGHSVAITECPSPITQTEDNHTVFMPDEFWARASKLIASLVAQFQEKTGGGAHIAGVCVTGMAESGFPLDKDGNWLYPMLIWYDPCTLGMDCWWNETFGMENVLRITGQRAQHNYTINRLIWLKDNHPDVFNRMDKWLCVPDYTAYKLGAEMKMDYTSACRTLMFDIHKRDWSNELLAHGNIPREKLPPVTPSGSLVGHVSKEAAACTGLSAGTPIFAGGQDHICGALASGILTSDVMQDSSGTAEQVLTVAEGIEDAAYRASLGFNYGIHSVSGLHYLAASIPSSGRTVDWFRRQFAAVDPERESAPGAHGVMFLPHTNGGSSPLRNPISKAAFLGIKAHHTHADFMRAVYEGLCYEFRYVVTGMLGKMPPRIHAIGGGTRNPIWIQTKANITNTTIIVPEEDQTSCMGAALLAGIGCGLFKDEKDAVDKTFRVGKVYEPQNDYDYTKGYEIYTEIASSIYGLNEKLETLQ